MPDTILVVEDDAIICMRLEDALESWGYGVVSAPSGEEAIAAARAQPFSLVLMDIRLDGAMDGVQAAQQLKTELQLPSIFLTAFADDDLMERAQLAEPYGYLIKPVSERELKSTIRMALYKRQMEEKMRAEEKRSRALIEKSYEVVLLADAHLQIVFASPAIERMLGYTPAEVLGRRCLDFFLPADRETLEVGLIELLEVPGEHRSAQARLRHKGGEWRWVEVTSTNQLREPGVGALVLNILDITARKQVEAQFQKQVERLVALRAIDTAINSSIDLRVMLQILLEQVLAQLQADAADILILNPSLLLLETVAGRGFRTDAFLNTSLRLGTGVAGKVAFDRRAAVIDDLRLTAGSNPRFEQAVRREGFIFYYGVPLVVKGEVKGVLEIFHRARFNADPDWREFVAALAGQAALAIDNSTMFREMQRSHNELVVAYDSTIEGWSRALDLRDKETEGHSRRVMEMTIVLARAVGMNEADLVHVRRGALLHDIGKMGVPDGILLKEGPLTDEEWKVMRKHPVYAYEFLAPVGYLRPAIDIPYAHHEKWDGSGYPRGLKGAEIPLAARVFAVIDVWDAVTHDRPYRAGWTYPRAMAYLREQAGQHFDPHVLEVFLRLLEAGEIE